MLPPLDHNDAVSIRTNGTSKATGNARINIT